MSIPQRMPFLPRILIGIASSVLVVLVGAAYASAQSSEPVSTGNLISEDVADPIDPGGSVSIAGSGFAPGADVDITIESEPVHLATVVADAAGSFSTTVIIPSSFPGGAHTLKATGAAPGGGLRVLSVGVEVTGATGGVNLPRTGASIATLTGVGMALVAVGFVLVRRRSQA